MSAEEILLTVAVCSAIVTPYLIIAVVVARLWSEVRAMQESTHSIQYVDPLKKFNQDNLEAAEKTDEEVDVEDLLEDNIR